MRSLASVLLLTSLLACTDDAIDPDGGAADIQGDEEKSDGTSGIEVTARIEPGTVDAALSVRVPRRGYVFYAGPGTKATLEVTRTGSSTGLDTVVKVYGPRLADGSYPRTLGSDEDDGYGKLSLIRDLELVYPGFYLVEVSFGEAATPADGKKARLSLSCDGTCASPLPIDTDLGLDWHRRSAERRALGVQAYATALAKVQDKVANISGPWGVVLDIDETTLDNSLYQRERMDLGLGYSSPSWRAWVERRAAPPIDGVRTFLQGVKQLGGTIAFVSNRTTFECPATKDNLAAAQLPHDEVLCKSGTSDKNPRFTALANGTAPSSLPAMEIVMFVGDNIQDFPQLNQSIRTEPESAFAKFGDEFMLLPNPMYGSWEDNETDN